MKRPACSNARFCKTRLNCRSDRHKELRGALRRLRPHDTFRPGLLNFDEDHDFHTAFERGGPGETERRKNHREDLPGQHKIGRLRLRNDLRPTTGGKFMTQIVGIACFQIRLKTFVFQRPDDQPLWR